MEDGIALRPYSDYVLIRRIPDAQVGRIVVPGNVDTKPRIGIVEAIGPGRVLKTGARAPMAVSVGDRVKFSLDSGYVSRLPGERFGDARLLIRETAIEAVLPAEVEASAVGSPWPAYITEGPQG